MKTLICNTPGKFTYEEQTKPILVEGHTLLEIKQVGICGTDYHAFEGTQPFFNYPRILGHEIAAEVAETTQNSGLTIGELVTISPYYYCGHCIACRVGKTNCCTQMKVCGVHIDGAMQEYFLVPDSAVIKGNGLSAEELVLVEPLAIGAHGVSRANITTGEFVLVIGAGPIGLATMNFARIAGAQVIAMDVNTQRLEFCAEKIGVQHIINPQDDNAMEKLSEITKGDMPTVVIDCSGNLKAINNAVQYMAHGARFVLIGLQKEALVISHPEFHKREGTLMSSRNAVPKDFEFVIDCIKKGLVEPKHYITHRIKFENVKNEFASLTKPENKVIKAIIAF
ncbi:MAG: zinc-binding alcohol dehydrogenase family protein [Pedobacter sp.]|nr:MAG: zinc-binding alcohol dehydrogenase family protein [Pedobacter sp.]